MPCAVSTGLESSIPDTRRQLAAQQASPGADVGTASQSVPAQMWAQSVSPGADVGAASQSVGRAGVCLRARIVCAGTRISFTS